MTRLSATENQINFFAEVFGVGADALFLQIIVMLNQADNPA